MKLIFRLRYHTKFGQNLFLIGDHERLGGGRLENATALRYVNPEFWQAEIELPDDILPETKITWDYLLREEDGSMAQDQGTGRSLQPGSFSRKEILIVDSWNESGRLENVFYTKPFKSVWLRANNTEISTQVPSGATHLFRVKAPSLAKGQTLCLLGGCAALGDWNFASAVRLDRHAGEEYLSVQVDLRGAVFPLGYKFGVFDTAAPGVSIVRTDPKRVQFEEGENRILADDIKPDQLSVVDDGFVRLPMVQWKGAGIAIPVFSLRTQSSFGVGEFTDIKPLADWCERVGLKVIQLLPVNDTSATQTWLDSYPYAGISAFALHPLYLNLNYLANGAKKGSPVMESQRRQLNELKAMDYEAVMQAKMEFVREIFPKQRKKFLASQAYREFFEQNRNWLEPYAAFCCLRDKFGTADFNQWPSHRVYRAYEIEQLGNTDPFVQDALALNYFLQFHLHSQLKEASDYAHSKGVIVKGDIAIGVYRHGADVWQQPDLFKTRLQAGAPPDPFAAKGQNWGFPTYDWPRMKKDRFAWWRQRFEHMAFCFDAFRIDHVLGFFRIWSIPMDAVEGILGHFEPALPVRVAEFARRGISFDYERFVRPWISDEVLKEIFGAESVLVKKQFLQIDFRGRITLKPEFATQRQVQEYFDKANPAANSQKLRQGLLDLISNVILLEVEGPEGAEFHFRFGVEETWSFKHLDTQTQARLKELYLDYFFRRQEAFWKREGMEKLPALKRVTNLLICGEDLGMVPACVPEVMKQLGLLSLEIQRMPKALNADFSRPAEAPYLSVVTPSTHDMSTIRGWWEEDDTVTRKFYQQELGATGEPPKECSGAMNQTIVEQHLASPAMLSIFQLQDLLGMDESLRRPDIQGERINIPADPRHYWRYRMHLTLEDLLRADAFNDQLLALIRKNHR